MQIREQADGGLPTVVQDPAGDIAGLYRDAARHLAARLWGLEARAEADMPEIRITDD